MKKAFMIFLLILFLVSMGVIIVRIENSAKSKQQENKTEKEQVSIIKTGPVRKSSNKADADLNNMIEIKDNFFIESVNDVFLNMKDYIGKTIKFEGLIYTYQDYTNGDTCYAVIRNTPGCCGNDGLAGLDIRYYDEYPPKDTWVEVIGVVEKDIVSGNTVPALLVYSLTEKEEGKTFVTN